MRYFALCFSTIPADLSLLNVAFIEALLVLLAGIRLAHSSAALTALAKGTCSAITYSLSLLTKPSGIMTGELYERETVKLLNTYDDHGDAKDAAEKLVGEKRLASERDATVVIYNLFGIPSWGNFHRLDMYNLVELKGLLDRKTSWQPEDAKRHHEILATLNIVAKNYSLELPFHWK